MMPWGPQPPLFKKTSFHGCPVFLKLFMGS